MGTRIAGNFVVWNDTLEMKWFGYDLAKRESFPIVAGMPMNPVINESYMVWSDGPMMNWNGFELATKRRFSLGITDADGMSMKMTGRFLIYRGMMDMTVRGVDLASGEKFVIATTDIEYHEHSRRGRLCDLADAALAGRVGGIPAFHAGGICPQ